MKIGDLQLKGLQTSMSRTTRAIDRALSRLSSGSRLSRPADDIAAYSVSTTLEAQSRGLGVALQNLNSAQSALVTAESALNSQIDITQKLRELAVQASNGSLSTADRASIRSEASQLLEEFQRLSTTTYNDMALLDGSRSSFGVALEGSSIDVDLQNSTASSTFTIEGGTGNFSLINTTYAGSLFANRIQLVDLDRDGDLDSVTGFSTNSGISIALNDGSGQFSFSSTLASGVTFYRPEFADLNGDGMQDIISVTNGSNLYAFLNNGDGTFQAGKTFVLDGSGFELKTGDFNQDGILDFAATLSGTNAVEIAFGNGDGTFKNAITYASGGASNRGIAVGDLNGDNKLDFVFANNTVNGLTVYFGNGNGQFTPSGVTLYGGNTPMYLSINDVNGDGRADITAATNAGYVSFFLGNGAGSFSAGTTITLASGLVTLSSADFNRDGAIDFAVLNSTTGDISTLINSGTGTFTRGTTLTTGASSLALALGDVDGDLTPDLLSTDWSTGVLSVYRQRVATRTAIADILFDSTEHAGRTIEVLDRALQSLMSSQSELSAAHNRLDAAASQQLLLSESLSDAKSRLVDGDIADETAELVRQQILQQAQISVAAQANLQMQTVLQLLRS